MAENIRSIKDILEELFKGNGSALSKYAKVRHTQYELRLWRKFGYPLNRSTSAYFSKAFLNGVPLKEASDFELEKGFDRLNHAILDGCHGRCVRLCEELIQSYEAIDIEGSFDIERFLDLMSFSYDEPSDCDGNCILEPGYDFPIRIFHDADNRRDFWHEAGRLIRQKKILSVVNIYRLVMINRRAVTLPDE